MAVAAGYTAGFVSHLLIQRWVPSPQELPPYPVAYAPPGPPPQDAAHIPAVEATDLEKIRALVGVRVRVRGRIFRVGHSSKSNTYFINFGPSRSSFTGIVFSSSLERFARLKVPLSQYEGREVELTGEVRSHPRYGLEMILEDPSQIQLLQ